MKKIIVAILLVTMALFALASCGGEELPNYTVTFDTDGGTAVAAQTVEEGQVAIKPADPTKEGFTFAGWFVGETAYDFSAAVTANLTVKAKWTQNTYTVSFDTDGAAAIDAETVAYGATATKPADPIKEGFTFMGWFVGDAAYDFTAPVKANVEIKAKWAEITYTVTFDTDGAAAIDAQTVAFGGTATKPADPTKEGYTFAGWTVNGEAYDFATVLTADVTIKATWAEITYTVTFDTDGAAAIDAETVAFGGTATKPADPTKEGYTFAGWTVNGEAYDFATVLTADVTIKATWAEITYTVTFDTDNGAEATTETVKFGGTATKPADPTKAGFYFMGWTVNGEAYDFATVLTGDITVKAEWLQIPDLTAIAGKWTGTESVSYMTNSYEFVIEANGTITATYNNGYTDVVMTINYVTFENNTLTVNYSATSTEGADMVFTLSEDKGVLTTSSAAAFNVLKLYKNYTVTFDWGNYKDVIDPTVKTVKHGDTVTAPTKSWTGYEIKSWKNGEAAFDFTTPITSDMTLVAEWGNKIYDVTYYNQAGEVLKVVPVKHGEMVPESEVPTTGITTVDGAVFNGFWYGTAKSNIIVDVVTKAVTGAKNCYPGVINPMTDIDGTWTGADSANTKAWVIVVDAANGKVTASLNGEDLDITWFRFQELDGKLQLVIYNGSSNAFTYDKAAGTITGGTSSKPIVLKKAEAATFTVTFDSAEGTAVDAQTVADGATATEPTAPTKDGFTFDGWYNGENKYDFSTPVTADITLTAKWVVKAVEYTVTFDLNGGTLKNVELTQTVAGGACATALASNPTKSNYTFEGWYNGDTLYDFTTPVNADITLTAKWKGVMKTIKIFKQDGSVYKEFQGEYGKTIGEEIKKNLTEEEYANLAKNLMTEEGSYFTGEWFSSANGTTVRDFNATVGTAAINVHPSFVAPVAKELEGTWTCTYSSKVYEFTIKFETDAEGNIIGVTAKTVKAGTEADATIVRTYIKDGQLPQIIIKSDSTYTIKQVLDAESNTYVWQYSNQTLTKVEN